MRALGLLLLLFGMLVLALNWLEVQAVRQWGEDGALLLGCGGIVLGLVLTLVGRKKSAEPA